MTSERSRRSFAEARRRRTRRVVVVLSVSLIGALLVLGYALSPTASIVQYLANLSGESSSTASREEEVPAESEAISPGASDPKSDQEPIPEPQPDTSPEAVAYRLVASEIPDMDTDSIKGVYKSRLDPSWASVHAEGPREEGTYVIFLQQEGDSWKARKSVRADEPESPQYEKVVLDEVPEDLIESIYPQSLAAAGSSGTGQSGLIAEPVEAEELPTVEAAKPPEPETDASEVPEDERERVDEGLEDARQEIEYYADDYEGTAGVYVQDVNGGFGYGVNPDEAFFGASVMKIPLLVAVFRKIDEGEISLEDSVKTEPGDWAGGAGWLQWEEPGTPHLVQDHLWMMMTQSDNVATNALLRLVGGPEYVNEVAKDMGASDTFFYQKVTSERAAVLQLDNTTTPRDMATILGKIASGTAASRESCQKIIEIMSQNELQSSIKDGLPADVEASKKGGWLYKVYDEAGIVWHEDRPYVIAIFSKHGSEDVEVGKALLRGISKAAYKAQDGSEDAR
ncbi:MAG: serine hydrolase [Actinomycetota bacterium]|nr:serine hydrolase [Actinomycetota bacterium]